ncbi:hypothetical protein F0562_003387 [Nyssa sinensis]|uniref:Uncharacterized protein n=1 Tax=Nyssa sinensis TaxID=561372 RepID=A0A5J5BVW0_9ASTE|nr:hypothetical protein F0562_003387 [Nyssa sinensis]
MMIELQTTNRKANDGLRKAHEELQKGQEDLRLVWSDMQRLVNVFSTIRELTVCLRNEKDDFEAILEAINKEHREDSDKNVEVVQVLYQSSREPTKKSYDLGSLTHLVLPKAAIVNHEETTLFVRGMSTIAVRIGEDEVKITGVIVGEDIIDVIDNEDIVVSGGDDTDTVSAGGSKL